MRYKNKKTDIERRTLLESKEAYNVQISGRNKPDATDKI